MNALVALPRPGAPVTRTGYERMRAAVAEVATADEAKAWIDKAAAAAFYARQIKDREVETWLTEIKRRAEYRLGEMLLTIPPHKGGRPSTRISGDASSIRSTVLAAGLDPATATRLMQLAGPRDEDLQAIGRAAAETYYARAREQQRPATRDGLRAHIDAAIAAVVGPDEVARRAKALSQARQAEKARKRHKREADLADRTRAAAAALGQRRYNVILADPEWEHKTWSAETGMDRAAANHYPTSPLAAICARDVTSIAAEDSVLALWTTVPMLLEAFCVMDAWGFSRIDRDPETGFLTIDKSLARYVSSAAWTKYKPGSGIGMGYWFRVDHEILLLATRGKPPAPSPTDRVRSVFDVPASRVHSQKPELVCEILEAYFPNLPKIELNRRGRARPGWDVWGNEVEPDEADATPDDGAAAPLGAGADSRAVSRGEP